MRYRVLDVETISHESASDWLEPVAPDSRLKDPEKIAASIAEKTADRNEKLSLDPDCCRIVALGYSDVGYGDPTCALCYSEQDEKFALERFWESFRGPAVSKWSGQGPPPSREECRLITFYGFNFDLPVLLRRSMYLGVSAPKLNLDKYRSPHIDLWNELTYRGALRTTHGLKFFQKRFGLPSLDKVDGADVAKLWAAGEFESVREHCLSDVGLTHALANKLGLLQLAPDVVGAF